MYWYESSGCVVTLKGFQFQQYGSFNIQPIQEVTRILIFVLIPAKNAGHNIPIDGEPCNIDAHANIPALFLTMFCPQLTDNDYDCTVDSLADQIIASIQGTPHTHQTVHIRHTESNVELGFPD